MVKPALAYLDVIARVRDEINMPIAAYNVSGEYAMIEGRRRARLDRSRPRGARDADRHPPRRRRHHHHLSRKEAARAPRGRGDAMLQYKFVEPRRSTDEELEESSTSGSSAAGCSRAFSS